MKVQPCSGWKLSGPIRGVVICETDEELKLGAEAQQWYLLALGMHNLLCDKIKGGFVGSKEVKAFQAILDQLNVEMEIKSLSFRGPRY
jgi:hypothetical protein